MAGVAGGDAYFWDLTASPDGNVIVTGNVEAAGFIGSWATLKYDRATGGVLWGPVYLPASAIFNAETPWQILTDGAGDVFVAGATTRRHDGREVFGRDRRATVDAPRQRPRRA